MTWFRRFKSPATNCGRHKHRRRTAMIAYSFVFARTALRNCLEARSQDTENQLEQIGHQDASLRRPPAASTPNRIFGTHNLVNQGFLRFRGPEPMPWPP